MAQLAINANDSYRVAQGRVEAARGELEAAQQEKDFLVSEMARLRSELEQELVEAEGEDAAIEQALVTGETPLAKSTLLSVFPGDKAHGTLPFFSV